jgi:hypothetical protein
MREHDKVDEKIVNNKYSHYLTTSMQENMLQISMSNYQNISIHNNFNAMLELFYLYNK